MWLWGPDLPKYPWWGMAFLEICLPDRWSFLSIHHGEQQKYKMALLNFHASFSLFVQGRGIFASGSPFSKVTLPNGQTFFPGQGNNAYVFPGVALGVIACGVRHISDDIFLLTAQVSNRLITTFLISYEGKCTYSRQFKKLAWGNCTATEKKP